MIWVIGERTGRVSDDIVGGLSSSERLAQIVGVGHMEFLDAVLWLNLWDGPTGTRVERYVRLVEGAADFSDSIWLLGQQVLAAWRLDLQPLQTIMRNGGAGPEIVAVPHTSGRNLWWNDPDHQEDAAIVLRRIWGSRR